MTTSYFSLDQTSNFSLFFRCITSTLSDSQLQNIERESANRSLFARELIISTLAQTLPELQQSSAQTSSAASNATTATTSPETPNVSASTPPTAKKSSIAQDAQSRESREQQTTNKQQQQQQQQHPVQSTQQQQQHNVQAAIGGNVLPTGHQSQGLPPNPNNILPQNAPMVQTLMHSVLPQPLVGL